jgi:Mg-chelatase subunit ChlD
LALIELGSPELLLLAPLFITLTLMGHYFAQRLKRSLEVFHYPPVKRLSRVVMKKGVRRSPWRGISLALKLIIIVLITFSLANPSLISYSEVTEKVEVPMVMEKDLAGQIILAVDVSPSMGLKDVYPSRINTTKNILVEFVKNSSENVRFGVIAFDFKIKESLALTDDKNSIVSAIENITASESLPCLEEFTDIGFGLQMSLDLLTPYSSSNRTSAIILVSDGFANYGHPSPLESVFQATTRANAMRVPVYAMHVARMGQDSNDELMKQIADATNGKFMDSTNSDELKDVFDLIGKYYVPTHEWSSLVEIKTTTPVRAALGLWLMFVAAGFVVALWVGNYRHYKTSF